MTSYADVTLESLRFDRNSGTYRGRYEREATSAPMAVIAVVAEALNLDPLEIDPLHDSVDTDALNDVFRVRDALDEAVRVSFSFNDCDVTVSRKEVTAIPSPKREPPEGTLGEVAHE